MPIPTDVAVRFISPLGDQLLFHRMEGEEELGRPFKYDLTLLSERGDLVLSDLLGQVVTVELDLPDTTATPNDGIRYFNGYVTRFSRQGAHGQFHVYSATVHPWLWLLGRATNCRIFQEKTVPEIIKEVFRSHGLTDFEESLTEDYASREFVVQYNETDLNFVSRLMEAEGIYYYFTHQADKHLLVLADSYSAHEQVSGYEEVPYIRPGSQQQALPDHLDDWEVAQQMEPGTVFLNDFNFETPKANLLTKRSAPNPHERADFEHYHYPGDYLKSKEGEGYARLRLEEINVHYEQAKGSGNARGLATGSLFSPTNLPVDSDNREYLLVAATYTIEGPEYETQGGGPEGEVFRCTFVAIDSKCPFRPQRSTPRPATSGPQTATVVGEAGEEIWTDKYGRVKVQFHWDREGQRDENSSCWVRVAQVWAGTQWGAIHIPRIGQEVIVDFLEGDPDKPIITGRVYNADNMPPYTLPDNKTQSGIKSRSSKGGTDKNFNEIRFEDLKGKEELHIQAEKDMSTLVKHNQSTSVGADRSVSVGGNHSVSVTGTQSTTVTKKETQTYQADREMKVTGTNLDEITAAHTGKYHAGRTETVEKGDTLTVVGSNKVVTVHGEYNVVADTQYQLIQGENILFLKGKDIVVNNGKCEINLSGPDATVTAKSSLTLQCGEASITLKTDGTITINGSQKVALSGGGSTVGLEASGATMSGMKVGVSGQAITEITGALIKIN
jgi:type VI secretion system secreted protein VgrG